MIVGRGRCLGRYCRILEMIILVWFGWVCYFCSEDREGSRTYTDTGKLSAQQAQSVWPFAAWTGVI
jgi:hypothetical protein